MNTAVVEGTGIVKRFGETTALDGATFAIDPGVTGLLGANGAGKTTLLGLILGLQPPTEGSVRVFGLEPRRAGAEIRARIGYSPEHHTLPPDIRAHDFVRHMAEIHGLPRREATARSSDALWLVGLGEERFRPLGTMSTGQRQRVKLAQAIAHDPKLVLLDEPTDGLDPVQRDDMLNLIRRVGAEFDIDVVLSSHLLEEVERVCDNAVIIADGVVVANGRIDELTGDTTGVVIEVDDGVPQLAAALERPGVEVTVDGNIVRLEAAADIDLRRIVRDALAETGVPLRRLRAGRRSLEDLFFQVGMTR